MGGNNEIGAFKNCFGGSSSFVNRASLARLGSFNETDTTGYEDWEFYANATLNNLKVDVVPRSLYKHRLHALSENAGLYVKKHAEASRRRSLRPYLAALDSDILRERLLLQTITFDDSTKDYTPKTLSSESTSIFPRYKDKGGNSVERFF